MSFEDSFNRILDLIRKTGDKLVVLDRQDPSESFVVMPFEQYENIADNKEAKEPADKADSSLTEEDLTDKINSEISNWKHEDESQYIEEEFKSRNPWKIPDKVKDKAQKDE